MFLKFFTTLLMIFCFSLSLHAAGKTHIFTLHSYSQEYPWTKSQYDSFMATLLKSENELEFYSEYLDTKRLEFTQEYQERFVEYLNNKYSTADIDLIYVTDDNALSFIYNNHKKLFINGKKIPVIFSGINDLAINNILPKETFLGVFEVKEIKENIELVKQFSPQTRDIYFIGDASQTYTSIRKVIEQEESNFEKMHFHYISELYLSNIKEQLPTNPRSFVFLTTIGQFKDDMDKTLLVQESIKELRKNKNLILLTMEDAYMYKGVVGGYVTSGFAQGREAAQLVLEYIKEGSLKNLHSLEKSPNIYVFNAKELTNSRIVLSQYIARQATMIGEHKNFLDDNNSTLLSILSVLVIVLLFSMIIMNAVFRKKFKQAFKLNLEHEINDVKQKLHSKEQFIDKLMSFGHIGYWRLDVEKDKLFLSENLLETLFINHSIYEGDSAVLSYFTYEYDKVLLEKNIREVIQKKNSISFKHKMISSEKELFNVEHLIYAEHLGHEPSFIVMGIIKFEK